jgi:hypothetical protein
MPGASGWGSGWGGLPAQSPDTSGHHSQLAPRRSSSVHASIAPPPASWSVPEPEPEPEPVRASTGEAAEEHEQLVEHQIALSVINLEDQLQSVQREAAQVLGLCDSTTAFTNEVRDGLRSARASMAEQRAAMDKILASVTGASPDRLFYDTPRDS